jgi:hypothetical protein
LQANVALDKSQADEIQIRPLVYEDKELQAKPEVEGQEHDEDTSNEDDEPDLSSDDKESGDKDKTVFSDQKLAKLFPDELLGTLPKFEGSPYTSFFSRPNRVGGVKAKSAFFGSSNPFKGPLLSQASPPKSFLPSAISGAEQKPTPLG